MKVLACLLMLISVPALAQRQNECAKPGTVVSTRDLGEAGDEQVTALDRQGNMDIASTASYTGVVRTKVHHSFEDNVCVAKTYTQTQRVCEAVSADLALGRGNATLASFYDLHKTILQRSQVFAKVLVYSSSRSDSERLEMASRVVTQLTATAADKGLPRRWTEFAAVLNASVQSNDLPFSLVEEILITNQAHNQKALGFLPLEGATVRQGTGNGRLSAIFDLNLSPAARAQRIQVLIQGITQPDSINLARSFVDFANRNGIPSNWDQFVMMMRSAVANSAITERVFAKATIDFETANRNALGYSLSAEYCRMVDVTKTQNIIEIRSRKVLVRESIKNYQVNIANAPLLQNEVERFSLVFDGIKPLLLKVESGYNKYQLMSQSEVNGVTQMQVQGTRLAVTPQNTLKGDFSMAGDVPQVRLQNASFNPKAQGRVMVKVKYINGRLFGDRIIAEEIYELKGADVLIPVVAARNKEIDFIKVSIQIIGSPYYNTDFSADGKIK